MKKIVLVFACISVLSLAACGKNETVKTTKSTTVSTSSMAKEDDFTSESETPLDIDWPSSDIGKQIPKPTSGEAEVIYTDEVLRIDLKSITKKDYDNYYNKIKKKYSRDVQNQNSDEEAYFRGYNKENYELELYFDGNEKTITIALESPKGAEDLTWPTDGLGKQVPSPDAKKGTIKYNSDNQFGADISEMSKSDFKKYISKLKQSGFTKNTSSSSEYFRATNDSGVNVSVSYSGGNLMNISAYVE